MAKMDGLGQAIGMPSDAGTEFFHQRLPVPDMCKVYWSVGIINSCLYDIFSLSFGLAMVYRIMFCDVFGLVYPVDGY